MRSTVFLGHSHRDAPWMERLVAQLRMLDPELPVDPWDDRRVDLDAGATVTAALARARIVVWLLSPDVLASSFAARGFLGEVDPSQEVGPRSVVLRVGPCPVAPTWAPSAETWPADGPTLAERGDAEAEASLAALARELVGRLAESGPAEPVSWLPAATRVRVEGLPVLAELDAAAATDRSDPRADAVIARTIEAWADPAVHAVSWIGAAGSGKSSLLTRLVEQLEADGWAGADAVFVEAVDGVPEASAERLVDAALDTFGDAEPGRGAPRERGRRLAELVRRQRALVVLDGVDGLLRPDGLLRATSLATALRELAIGQPGLLIVAGRRPIGDLGGLPGVVELDLDGLDAESVERRLERLGAVGGSDAGRGLSGNRLAVTLLGTLLASGARSPGADGSDEIARLVDAHLDALDAAADPASSVLRLVGLSDRPLDGGAVAALRRPPALPGLVDLADDIVWVAAVETLRERHLLRPGDPYAPGALDAPRPVRDRLAEHLAASEDVARAGHARLAEHYRALSPGPDTAVGRRSLRRAVHHGVRAGDASGALALARSVLSAARPGAGSLAIVASCYARRWDRPVDGLADDDRSWLDDMVGRRLLATGRPAEAVAPLERVAEDRRRAEDWPAAADAASRLARALLVTGRAGDALEHAEAAVEQARRSGSTSETSKRRCHLAKALVDLGRPDEALDIFRDVESIQARRWPLQPRLHSWRGHLYCELLLDRAAPLDGSALDPDAIRVDDASREACAEVADRAANSLGLADDNGWEGAAALARLDLGRAHLGLALVSDAEHWNVAAEYLDAAVRALHGDLDDLLLAQAFLARAMLRRLRSALPAADLDLREALAITRRGPLRLVDCDVRLERGRLRLTSGDPEGARHDLDTARRIAEDAGYRRRDAEIAALDAAL